MREILFKAKQPDDGKWVEGYLIKISEDDYRIATVDDIGHAYTKNCDYDGYMTKIEPETICQYTGLNDKNGNKIFEGDIIRIPFELDTESWEIEKIYYENARVYFDEKYHGWYVNFFDDALSIWEYDEIDTEVIGTIFDNPELLENE